MSSPLLAVIGQRVTVRLATIVGLVGMQILLTIACALALRQNQLLRGEVSTYQKLAAPPVGSNVPAIAGIDWNGVKRQVAYGEERLPTLVYGFSKDCGPCVANWAPMRTLQKLSPHRIRIVYVNTVDSVDALTDDYLREHGLDSDRVFLRLDADSALHYRVRATPQSQLVDRSGRVVWSKIGQFSPDDVAGLLTMIDEHEQSSEARGGQ